MKRVKLTVGSHKLWYGFQDDKPGMTVSDLVAQMKADLSMSILSRDGEDDMLSVWLDGFMLPLDAPVGLVRDNDTLSLLSNMSKSAVSPRRITFNEPFGIPESSSNDKKRKIHDSGDEINEKNGERGKKKKKKKSTRSGSSQDDIKRDSKKNKKNKKKAKSSVRESSDEQLETHQCEDSSEDQKKLHDKKAQKAECEPTKSDSGSDNSESDGTSDQNAETVVQRLGKFVAEDHMKVPVANPSHALVLSPASSLHSTTRHIRFDDPHGPRDFVQVQDPPPFNGLVLPLPSDLRAMQRGIPFGPPRQLPSRGATGQNTPPKKREKKPQKPKATQSQKRLETKSSLQAASDPVVSQQAFYAGLPLLDRVACAGEVIAFKVMELSSSYTPEISAFREATVVSVDQEAKTIRLRLSENSRTRTRGDWDGITPRKFELEEAADGEGDSELLDQEVEHALGELLDTRLIRK